LAAEEVEVEATSDSPVDEFAITEEPLLAVSITRIDAMSLSLPRHIVACLLVEWERSIDVAVYSVAGVHSIERLRMIVAQAEVANVLCKTVDVIVLHPHISERSTLVRS
jgi:hypothetical protein